MKVDVYSREMAEQLKPSDFPKKVAIISFYDADVKDKEYVPVDYKGRTERVFYVPLHDIDILLFR